MLPAEQIKLLDYVNDLVWNCLELCSSRKQAVFADQKVFGLILNYRLQGKTGEEESKRRK